MRKTTIILGLFMVVLLAIGLLLPSVAAYNQGAQGDSEQDQPQGDPVIPGPGQTSDESNEEMNNSGGGANNHEQNSEGAGLGDRTGF
jgi:hypothetical protein